MIEYGNWYLFQCVVDNVWMLEVIIREKVKLVQEVANVDTTKRIHLRKREDARKPDVIR